jgi:antitoxin CptB
MTVPVNENNTAVDDFRWQCRRGMLELDILLNNFIDIEAATLTSEQKQTFQRLLSYPDQTLLDLLMGNTVSSDPQLAALVLRIRSTASH